MPAMIASSQRVPAFCSSSANSSRSQRTFTGKHWAMNEKSAAFFEADEPFYQLK
jgi:hypothetical protein